MKEKVERIKTYHYQNKKQINKQKKTHHTLKVNKRGRKEQNNQKKKVTGQEYVLTFH
jgi:hypothetical protein